MVNIFKVQSHLVQVSDFGARKQHFVFGFDLVVLSRFAVHWLNSSTKNRTRDSQVLSADGPQQVNSCLALAFNV